MQTRVNFFGFVILLTIFLGGCAQSSDPALSLAPQPTAPVAPAPSMALTSIAPTTSPTVGGITLTVRGTGFSTGLGILIGTLMCSSVNVVSATEATCVVPAQAASTVSISLTNPNGSSAMMNNAFMYGDSFPAPSITTIAPTSGSTGGGYSLTVNGSNFQTGATVLVGAANCTSPNVVSSSLITCTIPVGSIGVVNVRVTNPDTKLFTLTSSYTYTAPPTYTQLKANVTTSRCSSCHGTNGGFSTEIHAQIASRTIPGKAAESLLYLRVANNSMPSSGGALTDVQKQMIFDWVQNGSLND